MSGFSFNAPSSTGGSGGGLFGSNTTPTTTGGSLFGNLGGTSSGASTPSLFGTANTSSAQSNPFGAKTMGVESGSSTPTFSFGAAQGQNKPASPFGGLSQTPNKTTEAPAPSQTQTAGGLFGAKPGGGGGGGLFGSNTPAQTKPATSLFSTTPANPPPGGGTTGSAPSLFGAQPSQKSLPPATTTESVATSQPQASNLFGQNTAAADKPLFGTAPSSTSANTLFGAANKAPATSDSGSKPLFGAPPTTAQPSSGLFKLGGPNAGGNAPASPFGAAAAPAPSTQPSTTAAPEATPQKSLFNIGGTSSTTPSSTPAAAPSLFTGIGKPASTAATSTPATTAAAATAPSGGLFAAKPAATATATTTTTATPATTATAGATTTAAAASAAPNAPKAPTPNLGASTFGPTPPAQSRLKNKTMDEIITRWATDLTKYQKEFKEQAEKVAEWDRMLVVNSAKVQKLYGNTVDAERATQEVERQLASVEGQQEELNAWLDRYEREVDEMLAKQVGPGETLQGPDQERERTYKLAEKLSERLDEMGKDLGSMIEEINNASSTLSKTNKTDEPISQIVRILNSHLSQLQMIDQGTAELQAKVSAAQKSGQSLGSRLGGYGHNGASVAEGLSAADDFYRSYMGRR